VTDEERFDIMDAWRDLTDLTDEPATNVDAPPGKPCYDDGKRVVARLRSARNSFTLSSVIEPGPKVLQTRSAARTSSTLAWSEAVACWLNAGRLAARRSAAWPT
jgi:hypothetical protein